MKKTDVLACLSQTELFSGLRDRQRAKIANLCQVTEWQAGDIIFSEGEQCGSLYLVWKGLVEIVIDTAVPVPDDDRPLQMRTIVSLGQGQVFGEVAMIDGGAHTATARCAEDGTLLLAIDGATLMALCKTDTDIGFPLMRNIAADLAFKIRHSDLALKD